MAWTPSESSTKIYSGPFLIGIGASGSEVSVGEIDALAVTIGITVDQIKAGAFYGTETVVDEIINGVTATATFKMKQVLDTTNLEAVAAPGTLTTLSAGSTSKSLTWDVNTMCGNSLKANASRIRFHKYSVSDLTDETKDIIFPSAVIYIPAEEMSLNTADGSLGITCRLVGFPDSNTDIIVIGQNVA